MFDSLEGLPIPDGDPLGESLKHLAVVSDIEQVEHLPFRNLDQADDEGGVGGVAISGVHFVALDADGEFCFKVVKVVLEGGEVFIVSKDESSNLTFFSMVVIKTPVPDSFGLTPLANFLPVAGASCLLSRGTTLLVLSLAVSPSSSSAVAFAAAISFSAVVALLSMTCSPGVVVAFPAVI